MAGTKRRFGAETAVVAAVLGLGLGTTGACGTPYDPGLFSGSGGSGGAVVTSSTSGSTASSSAAGGASTATASASASSSAGGSSSSSASASGSSSSTGMAAQCGDGICQPPETEQFCPQDCNGMTSGNGGAGGGGMCNHDACDAGEKLDGSCNPCAATVCASDAFCCTMSWDGQCVGEASQMCNLGCCGNNTCNSGEDCKGCPADCGVCPAPPACAHSVCDAVTANNMPADALDPTKCLDPCVDTVCMMDASCCMAQGWSGACQQKAAACGADPCVTAVCNALPACCSTGWTQACVDQAKTSCNTACDCGHDLCTPGDKLDSACSPCATSVCKVDSYCCDSGWDGICKGEVSDICGIVCN